MTIKAACGIFEYTPPVGLPFGRMSHHPVCSEAVHSPLTTRLLLMSDDAQLVGLLVMDQIRLRRVEAVELRKALAKALGVPARQFMIVATHTHNSPALSPWRTTDTGFAVLDEMAARAADLGRRLRHELTPVTISYARCSTPGVAHNRRSVYRAPDGREQVATHGSRTADNFIRVEGEDECELRVVQMHAGDGRLVAGIVNFPCHTTVMYGTSDWSADYPGPLRDQLAEKLGGPFIFINGFAGDQAPTAKGATAPERCLHVGTVLANAALAAVADAQPLDLHGGIAIASRDVKLAVRLPTYAQVDLAWAHLEKMIRGEEREPLVTRMYGYAYHFARPSTATDDWLAREIVARWELYRRAEVRHHSESVEAQVMRIGSLAIAGLPGEPFACFGRQLREASPIAALLCAEHTNGMAGYLPPADAFDRGGYECCLADQSRLEPAAGQRLTTATLRLLERLTP